ncbi:DUF1294 domain-containing protein [Agromyces sp. H3Y2-19a]|uniref:DUF1294 domain-containing protein n=1 Tax=Agromyces chromiiresistens TaxID=3030835 RepID=UPI0023B9DF5A|nr:DUF1294 domain-containing protein [Agromyces chromiiresistens]MDF0514102.1 DUF1294 domain-containing protein [Agromyces chromiiresistens]
MARDSTTAARGARPAASRPNGRPATAPTSPAGRDLSRPLPAALSWGVLAAFALLVAATVVAGVAPWWIAAWYGAVSLVAFAAYGLDKLAARRGSQRVPERTLHLLDVVGGWPGAIVAQQRLRHKTRKRSFRRVFWVGVVVNVLALGALLAWLAR